MGALTFLDYLALTTLLCFWLLYDRYAKYKCSKGAQSLMNVANSMRMHWIHNFMQSESEHRITDTQLASILHRGISFFVSVTIFIIGGLIAVLNSGETLLLVLNKLPFYADNAEQTWSIKVMFMIMVFVVAFFRLTWSLRQSQYYAVAIAGAPAVELKVKENYQLIRKIANLISDSSKNFNNALRSYYFGLSIMAWFVHPVAFIASNMIVVWVIYRREFHSKTLLMLSEINSTYNQFSDDRQFPE